MGIRFDNADKVAQALGGLLPKQAKNLARSTTHATAKEWRDIMVMLAPDHPDTKKGDIRRSTKHKRERMRQGVARSSIRIQTQKQSGKNKGFPYWMLQEYGNLQRKGVGRNSFVRPSWDRIAPDLPMIWRRNFGLKFEAMARRLKVLK